METNSLQGVSLYDMNNEYDSNEFIDIPEKIGVDSIQEIQVNDVVFESLKSQVDLYFHDHNLQLKELLVVQKNTFDCKTSLVMCFVIVFLVIVIVLLYIPTIRTISSSMYELNRI